LPYINTFRLARGLWRKPSMQADRAGAITEQGLVYRTEGGDRLLAWPEFTRRRQAPGLVVLMTGPGALTILPRSFFADEAAWRRFQEALDKRLPEGK
jgi:hypothetical protein